MTPAEVQAWESGQRIPYAIPEGAHGTWNGYSSWGCRCEQCIDAMHRHDTERYERGRTRPEDKKRQLRHVQTTRLVHEFRQ